MNFLAGTLFPSLFTLLVFPGCVLIGAVLLRQVRRYLIAFGVDASRHPAIPVSIWLFAVTGQLIVMAPQPEISRTGMLLMCGFLLQLAVMDAVSGWLPRPYTVACLLCGMLYTLACSDDPAQRLLETAITAGCLGALCHCVNRQRPRLGAGDIWLLCAQTAWLGVTDVMQAAFTGLSGFLLWQWVQYRDWHRCGFLGPWLCAGCIPVIIERLYQPVWVG